MTARVTRSLSREGRDTIWLLSTLALIMAPHVSRLPLWCSLGATAAMLWRGYVAWHERNHPPKWVLLAALIFSLARTLSTHHGLFGREAGVTLVVVLTGLKTLELRARRDAFVITSLGFFLVLTQFLYSQSMGMAALMFLGTWGLMTSLVLAQRPLGPPSLMSASKESGRTMLWGLPLMLVLFLLFPRMGPLWALPSDAQARTGLSDSLTLGRVAELAQDDSIAMHIKFEGPAPAPQQLYFRGNVLDGFDGHTWRTIPPQRTVSSEDAGIVTQGAMVRYQITLEPSHQKVIPTLEATLAIQTPPQQTPLKLDRWDIDWTADSPLNERIQLEAQAWPQYSHGGTAFTPELRTWTQLPAGFNPRTLAWARAFKRQTGLTTSNTSELVQAVLSHIRQGNFRYTLTPGLEATEKARNDPHQIDQFWLDTQAGFCEHFASSFVVVMRAMGIPSRVVTGYQGAELNPVDGFYIVRNSHAHAWAEYWQSDKGWLRVDPTAAVAPERIDRSRPLSPPKNAFLGTFNNLDPTLWRHAQELLEASNHRWNVWVLQYSRGRQKELLSKAGWNADDWTDIAQALAISLSAITLAGLAWVYLLRERPQKSHWSGHLSKVHQALTQAGFKVPHNCPAPAPALSWHQAISAKRTLRSALQEDIIKSIQAHLQLLDALRYGTTESNDRPTVKAVVKSIQLDARRWRAMERKAANRAH